MQPYNIKDIHGFGPTFSHLISMMANVRRVTLESVRDLKGSDLDFLLDEKANSIGALLSHVAATERWYQVLTFEEKEMEGDELRRLQAALDLGEEARGAIKGNELAFYLDTLRETRENTMTEFQKRSEDWLFTEHPFSKGENGNYFYMWFHVFEDEINHRGQISLIKKRIRNASA